MMIRVLYHQESNLTHTPRTPKATATTHKTLQQVSTATPTTRASEEEQESKRILNDKFNYPCTNSPTTAPMISSPTPVSIIYLFNLNGFIVFVLVGLICRIFGYLFKCELEMKRNKIRLECGDVFNGQYYTPPIIIDIVQGVLHTYITILFEF